MTDIDPAVMAAATIMADDGWNYHDPTEPCSECDKARTYTARAIVAAVRERIAGDIEAAGRDDVKWLSDTATDYRDRARVVGAEDAWKAAARIARGEQ